MTALLMLVLVLDLNSIRNEPDPERRSDLAIENANLALDQAKEAYSAGNAAKLQAELNEIADSVDLAYNRLPGSRIATSGHSKRPSSARTCSGAGSTASATWWMSTIRPRSIRSVTASRPPTIIYSMAL